MTPQLVGQLARFAGVGLVNTAVTTALWLGLARLMDVRIAYAIAFLTGLVFTTFATASLVFNRRLTSGTAAAFVLWYLTIFATGLLVVQVLTTTWKPGTVVVVFCTVATTAGLNFIGGRLIFTTEREQA